MRIYWIENKQRCGPATVPDILARIQLGELSADTLGWHSGCKEWRPLRELPALADFLAEDDDKTPAEESAPSAPGDEGEPSPAPAPQQTSGPTLRSISPVDVLGIMLPKPGDRLLARLVDMALYATLVLGIMYVFEVPYMPAFNPGTPTFWLPMPLLEALIIYHGHTTPGKRWIGIRLEYARRRPGNCLMRSILAFVLGMGCMMSPIMVVTMLLSYHQVKRRGVVTWDVVTGTLPMIVRKVTASTRVAMVFCLFFLTCLCSKYMQPWVPEMHKELEKQFPETVEKLRELMPPDER